MDVRNGRTQLRRTVVEKRVRLLCPVQVPTSGQIGAALDRNTRAAADLTAVP